MSANWTGGEGGGAGRARGEGGGAWGRGRRLLGLRAAQQAVLLHAVLHKLARKLGGSAALRPVTVKHPCTRSRSPPLASPPPPLNQAAQQPSTALEYRGGGCRDGAEGAKWSARLTYKRPVAAPCKAPHHLHLVLRAHHGTAQRLRAAPLASRQAGRQAGGRAGSRGTKRDAEAKGAHLGVALEALGGQHRQHPLLLRHDGFVPANPSHRIQGAQNERLPHVPAGTWKGRPAGVERLLARGLTTCRG